MKLSFKIAYRFLKNNKAQTLLIALAIGLGVSIQIFLGLLMQNLGDDLVNNTIGSSSQITLKNEDNEIIQNGDEVLSNVVKSDKRLTIAIEALDRPGLVTNNDKSLAILLRGFNLEDAENIYKYKESLINGTMPNGDNEVILGSVLATDLGISTGDEVTILTPTKEVRPVTVTGIVDLKVEALNKGTVVSNIDTVRSIYGLEANTVTSIETQVGNSDIFKVPEISDNIKASVSDNYVVKNWIDSNESLLGALNGQKSSSYTIQVFIILSVLVAIASILAITVMQKTKQIGILKAMGITDRKASNIFIIQGLLLGLIGAFTGSILGILLFKTFTTLVKNTDGTSIVSGTINGNFVLTSIAIAIVACIISSIVPSRKSLKLNPVDAIKM
ncbi:MAG: ABC transporter permease [Clostridium sp.]